MYSDEESTFKELLLKDNSVSIHIRNIQTLATEMYKVVNDLSPDIMKRIFARKNPVRFASKIFSQLIIFEQLHMG